MRRAQRTCRPTRDFAMASDRQIAANRLNGQKSTGPRTSDGKQRSRQNAVRHGLTAETVIGILEDADEYRAFEEEIIADCHPASSIERSLASRLASLLWRMRRASAIERGLFEINAGTDRRQNMHDNPIADKGCERLEAIHGLKSSPCEQSRTIHGCIRNQEVINSATGGTLESMELVTSDLAQSFLRLANSDDGAFDRLGRYEISLWRQAAQTIVLLNSYKWRAEDSRRRPRCRFGAVRQRRHHFFPTQFYEQR